MIIPIGSDVTASLNDHIIFECYSNEPVYWIFPWDVDRQHVWEPPAYFSPFLVLYQFLKEKQLYKAELNLFHVNYKWIGFYYCVKNSSYFYGSDVVSPIRNRLASKIYLYVEGTNKQTNKCVCFKFD